MIIGSGNPTPYDGLVLGTLLTCGLILLTGILWGRHWEPGTAQLCRWAALLVSAAALGLLLWLSPTTNGIIGAGRLISIWPAAIANALLFAIWTWR
jgi:hypothetical protein